MDEKATSIKRHLKKALVIIGDGLSSAEVLQYALTFAQFEVDVRHIDDLITACVSSDELSRRYAVIVIPGGSSYGDFLGAGKVLALKFAYRLRWDFHAFSARGGLVLGIGNGFQVLLRLGVFGKDLSVIPNTDGLFHYQWVKVNPVGSKCVWLKGLGVMDLPIAHYAGNILISHERQSEVLEKMDRTGSLCLQYEQLIFTTADRIAGLCDSYGRIFGLMPHPEVCIRWTSQPDWTHAMSRIGSPGPGAAIFENAYRAAI